MKQWQCLMALCQQGSVEYAELNGDRPEISLHLPEANDPQDLPVPVD